MHARFFAPLLLALPAFGHAPSSVWSASLAAQETSTFARTVAGQTPLYSWSDRNSKVLGQLPAGELIEIHDRKSLGTGQDAFEFLEISASSGLPVWVYGQYLQETGTPGILRCSGDNVRMRPGPGKGAINLPLSSQLMRGDEVRFLARNDANLPMDQDWVQVRSPQRARAWIVGGNLKDITAAEARTAWAAGKISSKPAGGTASNEAAELTQGRPRPASAGTGATSNSAMAEADGLFAKARAGEGSFRAAADAYKLVLEQTDAGSSLHALASAQLERAQAGVELEDLELEIARQKAAEDLRRREALVDREREQLEDTLHWGRFNGRGWVSTRRVAGEARYYLEWEGDIVREITCRSERYDLEIFQDCEVGVRGDVLRNPTPATAEGPAQPQLLDINRLEIISVRG